MEDLLFFGTNVDSAGGDETDTVILGVGNIILKDEGFGVHVVEELDRRYDFGAAVMLVDGGTLGMELLHFTAAAKRLLIIDAVAGGQPPGTLYRYAGQEVDDHLRRGISAHEIGLSDMLAVGKVMGRPTPETVIIGAEPFDLTAGLTMSEEMTALIEPVIERVLRQLQDWGIALRQKREAK